MITQTTITTPDGRELLETKSDSNKYIIQNETGIKYSSAVDVIPCRYTYTETEEEIPIMEKDSEITE